MTDKQIHVIEDLAKQSYELEGQGGLVHTSGHEALTSWRREAAQCADHDLVELLDGLDVAGWQEACVVYEHKYSALKYAHG